MNIIKTKLNDCIIIEPKVFGDNRGFFLETFQAKRYRDLAKITFSFVQDNHSVSKVGVLRGIHYQTDPMAQGKLVRVVCGEVFDVAVDLRRESKYFGRYATAVLSAENRKQLWIPPGLAHGFLVTSEYADFFEEGQDTDAVEENMTSLIFKNKHILMHRQHYPI